ncbi:nucleotidyltransferase domain-containing protein (plasmid) [Streptomyces sp. NBC_01435]
MLSGVPAVTQLLVRGSLATGTADRLSDVDLVVAVQDERLPVLMASLDAVMSTEFGALLPGWRDGELKRSAHHRCSEGQRRPLPECGSRESCADGG